MLACRAVRQALLPSVLVLIAGCPAPPTVIDSGVVEVVDAGLPDGGLPDAGRPPRDAGIPDAGFTAALIENWCTDQALARCSRDVRCGRLSQAGFAGCMLIRTSVAQCDQQAFVRGVQGRRTQYLESEAVRCLNGFAMGSCEETPLSCGNVFTGLAPPDAGCLAPTDCNAFGFCDPYDGLCPHKCRAWKAVGSTCDGFINRCDPSNGSCDNNDAGSPVCQPKKNTGDRCQRYDACGDGSYCVDGTCIVRLAGPGEACATRNGFPFCTDDYFCRQRPPDAGVRPPGTCERKSGLGGTCISVDSVVGTRHDCLPSLRCSTLLTTGVCLKKGADGEPCINPDDCEDSLYCDAKRQRCEALPDAGGNCSYEVTAQRCAPGNTCGFFGPTANSCVAWRALGRDCGYDGECLSNDCEYATLPDGGFGGTCIASCSQRADGGL